MVLGLAHVAHQILEPSIDVQLARYRSKFICHIYSWVSYYGDFEFKSDGTLRLLFWLGLGITRAIDIDGISCV